MFIIFQFRIGDRSYQKSFIKFDNITLHDIESYRNSPFELDVSQEQI